jgi:hypothetical protein
VGEEPLIEVALDLLDLLQVELVWLLGDNGRGLVHLAAASESGEQQARRFVETAGRGPLSVDGSNPIGEAVARGMPRLNLALGSLTAQAGGERLARAAEALGIRGLSVVPLSGPGAERGALVFAAPRTLSVPRGWAAGVAVASRYASLALHRLRRPPGEEPES